MTYIYIYHEEFRGSIKGVNKYIRAGDSIKPEDVGYFQHHYPDRILSKDNELSNTIIDKELYSLLSEQNKKIDKLIDIVNSSGYQSNQVLPDSSILPNGKTNQSTEKIEIQDTSVGKLLTINTSNIETQGVVGEIKTEGESVLDKINKIKLKRQIYENS